MNVAVSGKVLLQAPEFFEPAVAQDGEMPTTQLLVGGKWQPAASGEVFDIHSPRGSRRSWTTPCPREPG